MNESKREAISNILAMAGSAEWNPAIISILIEAAYDAGFIHGKADGLKEAAKIIAEVYNEKK